MLGQIGTADQMIDTVRKLDDGTKGRSWTRRVLRCINTLKEALEPYFRVVDILVSSKPEYAALVWGSIRLVFQVCAQLAGESNVTTLIEYTVGEQLHELLREDGESYRPCYRCATSI
jgi:hypothetical protein